VIPQRARGDAGTVTAFVASFTIALLAIAGLVVDGGYVLAARRAAFDEAEAAARAGAQAIDIDSLRRGGPVVLLPDEARQRALDYLSRTGHTGTVDVSGDLVTVHVRFEKPMVLLGIVGVGPATIDATGTARGVRAVTDQEAP
jgi:hypothetical protein